MDIAMEIISRNLRKNSDPTKGELKIKKGVVIDYNFGMKKAKVILHPTSLEGLLQFEENGFETIYKVKINYDAEDIFDVNKYIGYMTKNKLISKTTPKREIVYTKNLSKRVFNDLSYLNSIGEIYEYMINELGVSPRIYFKINKKSEIKKIEEKIKEMKKNEEVIEEKIKDSKEVISYFNRIKNELQVIAPSIDETAVKYTGKSFSEISKMVENEANKYISKIASDIANAYVNLTDDLIGGRVIRRIVKTTLERARENYFSDNLTDYLIINENYNEVKKITQEEYSNLVSNMSFQFNKVL